MKIKRVIVNTTIRTHGEKPENFVNHFEDVKVFKSLKQAKEYIIEKACLSFPYIMISRHTRTKEEFFEDLCKSSSNDKKMWQFHYLLDGRNEITVTFKISEVEIPLSNDEIFVAYNAQVVKNRAADREIYKDVIREQISKYEELQKMVEALDKDKYEEMLVYCAKKFQADRDQECDFDWIKDEQIPNYIAEFCE